MKIGFVLPCYNEYDNIFILIKQIKNTFNNHLIIIVDDSTTDKIKYKINKYKNIKYFKRKSKSGRGSAVIYGMRKISKEKILIISLKWILIFQVILKNFQEI